VKKNEWDEWEIKKNIFTERIEKHTIKHYDKKYLKILGYLIEVAG
jgi:hypothetical protein